MQRIKQRAVDHSLHINGFTRVIEFVLEKKSDRHIKERFGCKQVKAVRMNWFFLHTSWHSSSTGRHALDLMIKT